MVRRPAVRCLKLQMGWRLPAPVRPLPVQRRSSPRAHAAAIKRRKQIWEALHPAGTPGAQEMGGTTCPTHETDAKGRKKSPQQAAAFAADTAKVSGESKRDINRHVSRAEALGDDLQRVVGTSLNKGVELDALKTMPAAERKALIDRAAPDRSDQTAGASSVTGLILLSVALAAFCACHKS